MSNDTSIKFMDKAATTKAIQSIARRGKVLDNDIQQAALSCLQHADKHGDITLMNQLYVAMPRGARKAALAEWAITFGKFAPNTGDDKRTNPFIFNRDAKTNLDGAAESPWFKFKPEPTVDAMFDVTAALATLLKKAAKSETVNDKKLLASLKALAPEV